MKVFIHSLAIALVAMATPTAFAQQTGASTPAAQTAKTLTPAEFDKQVAKMQEQMTKMQEQMNKIQQAGNPQDRQRLLQDHWTSMQSMMTMMQGTWGGMMGCCGAGGSAMGGHMMGMGGPMMMWGNYQNLTPEQLKQRQYMMDRWVPMQQMMMDHMMWHQHWLMQPPASPVPPVK